ncbi:hypothetical protein H5410_032927 [Solanum commersonii]|uniref:Reverse transcriptase domain-containing protein n=1 Tax=Solanum commersonii TaxID=4109 RepID=A0A9J5YNN3_SOLCO|nr:hypothetical protein H5410_032927 [Solanum commersonii]
MWYWDLKMWLEFDRFNRNQDNIVNRVIKDVYDGAKTGVRIVEGDLEHFPIFMGLYQGSNLSTFLFALMMDELMLHIQCEVELGRTKTTYLECKFSGITHEANAEEISSIMSIIKGNGEIDSDVTHRIGAGWMKWRLASSVLHNKNMPPGLKDAEMRMLRWMYEHTKRDIIRNKDIWDKVRVASAVDKMWLRWFRYARKRCTYAPMRRCERLTMMGLRRGRSKPKKY